MNKTAVKNVATSARIELINQVALRAQSFGVTPSGAGLVETGSDYVLINGQRYPLSFQKPCEALCQEIKKKGFQQVVEEVAYTWFNRLAALRFMEVNDYLPSRIRVLSSLTPGKVDPDILAMYREVDFPVDETYVQQMLQKGDREAAYRHLLIAQCNQLSQIMPFLFEKINHYTELLLPSPLLHADSFINRMVREIDEDDFREVEIIGWMYQFYNAEKKDEIFEKLKKNIKIAKEDMPAATQLFTPKWIVKYMVENSLGQVWLDAHPDSPTKQYWRYYVEPAEPTPEVQAKLASLKNPALTPEEIKIIDPACGSGHMLVYAYDLLYQIYEESGYPNREIPYLILEKNLYGLDIDDRAGQLASFALMMKAREHTKRVFKKPPVINVLAIQETNGLDHEAIAERLADKDEEKYKQIYDLLKQFIDAKIYGSLIRPGDIEHQYFQGQIERILTGQVATLFEVSFNELVFIQYIIKQALFLSVKYDVVITNPPYMGTKSMNLYLNEYIRNNYPTSKYDLFAAFMERSKQLTKLNGYNSAIVQHSFMFLGSYDNMRKIMLSELTFYSMIHLGPRTFEEIGGEIVQSVAYVFRNIYIQGFSGIYYRLTNVNNAIEKEKLFLLGHNSYVHITKQTNFYSLPGNPFAYWISDQVRNIFRENNVLERIAEVKQGLATADNNRFLRIWYEVSINRIGISFSDKNAAQKSKIKWFPYNKGGTYKKWYGNQHYIINWLNDGEEIRCFPSSVIRNQNYYFTEGITWSDVSVSSFGARYSPNGFIFDVKGSMLFLEKKLIFNLLGFLCSKLANELLYILNPTMSFQVGNLKNLPINIDVMKNNSVYNLTLQNVALSETDWNSFETSWDFQCHPFLTYQNVVNQISQAFQNWSDHAEKQFRQLQANEVELNRIFIKIYGLEDELTPEVSDSEITVSRADRGRDAKSFLSYAVGCMMGRYSLDVPGLAFAGGEFDWPKYKTFLPDPDGILPITDKNYFEDDIIDSLGEFLKIIFGEETLQENLYWLADSLILKQNETPPDRLRRYFLDEFYKDHVQTYQKRPIYWLFDSGKKKGFRTLIYLHRYNPQTLAKLRLDYLQELQMKYSGEEKMLLQRLEQANLSRAEKTAANRRLEELRQRQRELVDYDKQLADYANQRIELDLDDGVVANYAKLQPLLATLR